MKLARNIAKFVLGLALLPVVMAALHALGKVALHGMSGVGRGHSWLWILYGMVAYLVVHLFFHKHIVAYVFSKDPVRRMWGSITGYKPPKAGERGTQTTDAEGRRPRFLARMAPFLFPIYTLVSVVVLVALDAFDLVRVPPWLLCFVLGLTYMFHLFQVGYDMKIGHPDLSAGSMVLSVALVILVNVQVVVLLLALAVPRAGVSWLHFNEVFLRESKRWVTDTANVARETFGF